MEKKNIDWCNLGVGYLSRLFLLGMLAVGLLAGCAPKNAQPDTAQGAGADGQEAATWYDALTEEDFANAKTPDQIDVNVDWHQRTLILLGELPEVSVRIYGEICDGEMLILEYQGQRCVFSKYFLTPRVVMPEFAVYDYDGDGTEESFDTLCTMPYGEVLQFCEEVSLTYEEGLLRIEAGADSEEHDLTGTAFSEMKIQGLALGDITRFSFGESGEVYCAVGEGLFPISRTL